MRSFEQYDEICKYFAEGKQRDNNANEIQKHLQLYDLSVGEYLTDNYALWLDFRMIDENELHGTGRRIENASEGITLQIEKKAETAGALNGYIYLNKTNDLILNLTPENVTQHSRIVTTTCKGSSTPTKMSKIIGRQIH